MVDKVALVTGGSAGIGEAICRQLVEDGYQVLSLARRPAESLAGRVTSYEVDLSDAEATGQLADELAAEYPITTLVHNAGAILEDQEKWPEAVNLYQRIVDAGVSSASEARKRIQKIRLEHWPLF